MRQLLSHAFWIGPKYLAVATAALPIALTIYWISSAPRQGQLFLYVLFLAAAVFIALLLGATAGLLVLPATQVVVSLLNIPRAAWPISHALLCGGLCEGAAVGYCIWVYGSFARALDFMIQPEVAIILWLSAIAGLLAGFLFGVAMRNYAEKNDDEKGWAA